MSAPAAFRATYSDWKLIRSRKVVQVVLEIPLEASGQAYDVLGGMPNPGAETWCAVARLNSESEVMPSEQSKSRQPETSPAPEAPTPHAPVRALRSPAQRAGIMCDKPKFWAFLRERHYEVLDAEQAAVYVRNTCGVRSRADILPGTEAEQRLNLIISSFQAWDLAPSAGAA